MTAPVRILRAADTVPGAPIRLERPFWLPQPPKRSLETLHAVLAEAEQQERELMAERRDLERRMKSVRADIDSALDSISDHEANLREGYFPEDAA